MSAQNLVSQIEAILFVAGKPLTPAAIARVLEAPPEDVQAALATLAALRVDADSGLQLIDTGSEVQLVTRPEHSTMVERFTTQEIMGELTRAQLETLTVVAYQGPITRPELEAIRGVNCAIILRNLLVRGLVEEEDSTDKLVAAYRLSVTALRHLGVSTPSELPEYDTLHNHPHLVGPESESESDEKNN